MSAFDLVIFDCDGTLVDSERLNNSATSKILSDMGFPQYDTDYCIAHFTGTTLKDILKIVGTRHGVTLPDNVKADYVEAVNNRMAAELRAAPDAVAVVKAVAASCKICVASNGQRSNVLKSLAVTGIDRIIPEAEVFTANMVANPKPAPDLFLMAAEKMGALPGRTLVIEDSIPGVTAGLAAGMTVFGYTGLAHDKALQKISMEKLGVHVISESLNDILPFMQGKNS